MDELDNSLPKAETEKTGLPRRHRRGPKPIVDESKTRKLRNVLNIVFIVGCILGMAWYFYSDHTTAYYILIVASVFKFVELMLRIMRI